MHSLEIVAVRTFRENFTMSRQKEREIPRHFFIMQ